MGKTGYIILGIIIFLALVLAIGYFKVTGSPTTVAFLNVEGGDVTVNTGSGWQPAVDQMKLGIEDRVKTGVGQASVVLHESIVVSLDPNTEIAIKDLNKQHVKLEQPSGQTWNKFTEMAGVDEFSVETPNTVATVRGTYFGVGMDKITVGEGVVIVEKDGQRIEVRAGKKVMVKDGVLVEEDMTPEETQDLTESMRRSVQQMQELREREARKHPVLLSQLKKKYGITDAQVKEHLDKADRGEYDLDELEEKSPVKIESVAKIKKITAEIIKTNKAIENLNQ
jgi:hypothetical protein